MTSHEHFQDLVDALILIISQVTFLGTLDFCGEKKHVGLAKAATRAKTLEGGDDCGIRNFFFWG